MIKKRIRRIDECYQLLRVDQHLKARIRDRKRVSAGGENSVNEGHCMTGANEAPVPAGRKRRELAAGRVERSRTPSRTACHTQPSERRRLRASKPSTSSSVQNGGAHHRVMLGLRAIVDVTFCKSARRRQDRLQIREPIDDNGERCDQLLALFGQVDRKQILDSRRSGDETIFRL